MMERKSRRKIDSFNRFFNNGYKVEKWTIKSVREKGWIFSRKEHDVTFLDVKSKINTIYSVIKCIKIKLKEETFRKKILYPPQIKKF